MDLYVSAYGLLTLFSSFLTRLETSVANTPTLIDQAGLLRTQMPVVISHASFISEEDANLLRQTNQYISTTPESEAHYGHDNPGPEKVQDQASLGVDTNVSLLVQHSRFETSPAFAQSFCLGPNGELIALSQYYCWMICPD